MKYVGKLYGKLGNKYFDTSHTSDDYDLLTESLKESTELASKLQLENINLMAENASLQFRMIELIQKHKKK
ncbi:hypothetical protein [uncultured Clostridium sp.]|uniref:hypothetical protein n=1 Tax=uncultured Clostridium sp. TaxID=59620 RepID=UPI002622EEBA|nr:hypothetical protein [uncultured Clostridium sp.]